MPSLLVVVFVIQLLIYLINTIGAPVITDALWTLFSRLPGAKTSHDARKSAELKREVVKLKRELNATSSQDEFARWAKVRRTHDKKMAEYDEVSNNLKTFKSKFEATATFLRYASTNGLRLFLQFWYSKRPMFWIPQGWVPGYVEWLLSFPRAPTGSVSIQIWGIACGSVIAMVGSAAVASLVLLQERRTGKRMEAGSADGGGEDKKEL